MAVAAYLNACDLNGNYPLTTAQVVAEVNVALASCERTPILNEASRLNGFNNLPCPLGGPISPTTVNFRNAPTTLDFRK